MISYSSTFNGDAATTKVTFDCPGFCGHLANSSSTTTTAWDRQMDLPGTSSTNGWHGEAETAAIVELIFAHCKPCPWGMRNNGHRSVCRPCHTPLHSYDYLFLLFHTLAPFFVNSTAIGYFSGQIKPKQRRLLWLFLQTICAFLESSLAFVCALLCFVPMWSLQTFGCQKEGTLREWYSMWHNPVLEYNRMLRCSYELVYPLFSLPFVLYAFNLAHLLVFRGILHALAALTNERRNLLPMNSFYTSLWTIPLLALAHSILSGLLYAMFPYLALFASIILLVVHLSAQSSPQQQTSGRAGPSVCGMFRRVFCHFCLAGNGRLSTAQNADGGAGPLLLALFVHLAMFAFALLALAVGATPNGQFRELTKSSRLTLLLTMPALLPVPLLFFILTVRLTAPNANSGVGARR